jgi:hypothetical protein
MAAIEVDQFLAQPPEQVWHALTDPDLLVRWLMPNDFRPAVGHQFTFRTEPVPQHGFDGSASLRLRGAGPADFPRRSSRSFLAPSLLSPVRRRPALAHDGFDDGDPGQRMTMGILGGGWRGHLIKRLGELLGERPG